MTSIDGSDPEMIGEQVVCIETGKVKDLLP